MLNTSIKIRACSHMFLFVRSNKLRWSLVIIDCEQKRVFWVVFYKSWRKESKKPMFVFLLTSLLNIILTFWYLGCLSESNWKYSRMYNTIASDIHKQFYLPFFFTLSSMYSSFSFSVLHHSDTTLISSAGPLLASLCHSSLTSYWSPAISFYHSTTNNSRLMWWNYCVNL